MNYDWKAEWEVIGKSKDIFSQLGRNDFSFSDLSSMLKDINDMLFLQPSDNLLDIGCANGIISGLIAPFCNTVTGVDFSETHIAKAKDNFKHNMNISFIHNDIFLTEFIGFNKLLINAVLQYLKKDDLPPVFDKIIKSDLENIFIGHVPFVVKKDSFIDGYSDHITDPVELRKKIDIWRNNMTWYSKKDFDTFNKTFHIQFLEPNNQLIQKKYCLNIALQRK